MLSLFKKLFGRSPVRAQAPPSKASHHVETNELRQSVDVAHLCLATILGRLPDELKPLVLKQPDDTVTVALPIATIVKQLPSGSVKVSLATLHRQAPPGILGPLPRGDKWMVEVPLAEVFRHLDPSLFKRRSDQRTAPALDSTFNLFGDAQHPYQIAPTAPEDRPGPVAPEPTPPPPKPAAAKVKLLDDVAVEPELEFKLAPKSEPEPAAPRMIAPPADFFEPKLRKLPPAALSLAAPPGPPPAEPNLLLPSITVPVALLCGSWPEPIRSELAVLNGAAKVALPKDAVTAGLARGKVTFTWGQIRTWIEPALGKSTDADEAIELTLPLKVVAPVFLAATKKPGVEQLPAEVDSEIPALFTDGHRTTEANEMKLAREALPTPIPLTLAEAPATVPIAEAPVEAPTGETPAAPAPRQTPETIGELFGEPGKIDWTPAEIVAQLATLPGVSGAVVALQEGLLVAHSLPVDVKSEVIAAFLPQLFARLNQYASEMKLGDVDDLLFTTHGAQCQIYRLGYVYLAVLGKRGESLPWPELRLVADELARQTHQS